MQIYPAGPIPDPTPNITLDLVPDAAPYPALNLTLPSLIQEPNFRIYFLEIYGEYGEFF